LSLSLGDRHIRASIMESRSHEFYRFGAEASGLVGVTCNIDD